jgi:hypothetical protein
MLEPIPPFMPIDDIPPYPFPLETQLKLAGVRIGLDIGEKPPVVGPAVEGTVPEVALEGVKPPKEDGFAEGGSLPPKYLDRGDAASGKEALKGWAVGESVVASDDRRSAATGADEGTCIG